MPQPRRSWGAAALVAVVALSGCTSDPEGPAPDDPGSPGASGVDRPARVRTTVEVGSRFGGIGPRRSEQVARKVAAVVDDWWAAAFLRGDYPTDDYAGAFSHFTDGARRQARDQQALLTTARIGERIESARALRRRVVVDVLSTGGRARGVTARVRLDLVTSGRVERRLRVQGRLRMVWQDGGWKVFAFDVAQGPKPAGRGADDRRRGRG